MYITRTGIASLIFALLHPGDAKAATINGDLLKLRYKSGTKEIPVRNIHTAEIATGWFWSGVQVRSLSQVVTISGLTRAAAKTFNNALENARVGWWSRTLSTNIESLRSVYNRLEQFTDPSRYITHSIFTNLEPRRKGRSRPVSFAMARQSIRQSGNSHVEGRTGLLD